MASNVDIFAESYNASQVVSLNSISTLIKNKEKKVTPNFYSIDDPKPVEFCMVLDFGGVEEDFLSLSIVNKSTRKVNCEVIECTLSTDVDMLRSSYNEEKVIDPHKSRLCKKFYKLVDLMKLKKSQHKWEIQTTLKIWYKGEFEIIKKMKEADAAPSRNLSTDLLKILSDAKNTDVSFIIDDQVLHAHRSILSARSDYFESMFESGMIEGNSKKVEIKECDYTLFKKMIQFLYTDVPPEDIVQIAPKLLPIADRYLMTSLKNHCVTALLESLNQNTVKDALLLAHHYNCPRLKSRCFEKLTLSMFNDWDELKNCSDLAVEYLQFLSNLH